MRTWWLCLIALTIAASPAGAVTVWRWVDQNGVTHYSDRPVEGAERIELLGAQTFQQAPLDTAGVSQQASAASSAAAQPAVPYRRFDVVSPAHQETLWNIGGTLSVTVELEPPLQAGHRLDVYLDGERRNLDATTTQLSVPEVYRGVHTLQAVIVDESGSEVLRSLAVTFMVQQTSIQNPYNRAPPARRN
ncbi:MAG TPA: DUF4124 domain-containing protein [Gammaproteobacteria bacterium]